MAARVACGSAAHSPVIVLREAVEAPGGLTKNPVGTGAFMLKECVPGEGALLSSCRPLTYWTTPYATSWTPVYAHVKGLLPVPAASGGSATVKDDHWAALMYSRCRGGNIPDVL